MISETISLYKCNKKNYLNIINSCYEQFGGSDNNGYVDIPKNVDNIFPQYNDVDKKKLMFTKESIYSVSGIAGALYTVDLIKKHYGSSNIRITDGTANIGSDTVEFGIHFNRVNAIEYDLINFNALKNNIELYGLKNVNLIHGDTNQQIQKLEQDVIFLDAPWGGTSYKNMRSVRLFLGKTEVTDFIVNNMERAKLFVLKVPYNYDFNYMFGKIKNRNISIYPFIKNDKTKYQIIIIDNK